ALRGHLGLDGGDRLVIPGPIATPGIAPTGSEEQDRKHHQPTTGVKHGTLLEVGYSQPPTVQAVNDVRFGDRVRSTHGPPEAARTSPPARPAGRLLTSSGASALAVVGAEQDEHLVLGAVAADHDARVTVAVSGARRALAGRIVLGVRARLADPSRRASDRLTGSDRVLGSDRATLDGRRVGRAVGREAVLVEGAVVQRALRRVLRVEGERRIVVLVQWVVVDEVLVDHAAVGAVDPEVLAALVGVGDQVEEPGSHGQRQVVADRLIPEGRH